VGAKFGVVIVLLEGRQVEVATFRTEEKYFDGRHPSAVRFVDAKGDASRRDFTVNGMFYDPIKRKVIDYVDGQNDLKKKLIKTIGNPQKRFSEDYLRLLRAIRFAVQLGFSIEPKTWTAICKNSKNVLKVSIERIAIELEGILVSPRRVKGTALLVKSGLAEVIFPGVTKVNALTAMKVLEKLPKKTGFELALAGFFSGCQTEDAIEKCRILKLSNSSNKHIKFLLTNRNRLLDENMSLAELKMLLAEPYFDDLYQLQRAIQRAAGGRKKLSPLIKLNKRIKALGNIELKPKPLLNGYELMQLGVPSGPVLGRAAKEMYAAQLENHLTSAEQAKKWIRRWLQKHRKNQ